MGSKPTAFNLSLMQVVRLDESFQKRIAKISRIQFPLIGGDLVKGPLQISVTVLGKPEKKTLFRSNAQSGDILCLSGALGSGYIGLKEYKRSGEINSKTKPYLFPSAQIAYGRKIANIATSAIDISDGIVQDLSRLISCSGVGCNLDLDQVPVVDKQYKAMLGIWR